MISSEQKQIIQEIKLVLKERKITYFELSQGIGIPESSLKKVFSGADCPLSKLLKIVSFLGLDLKALLDRISEKKEKPFFQFSVEQEEFFSSNLEYFLFFHKVFRDHCSSTQAQKEMGLSDKRLWKILRKLEEFKILEITNFPEIKFLVEGGLIYQKEGALQQKVMDRVTENFVEYLTKGEITSKPLNSPVMRLYMAKVSKKTYEEFVHKTLELHKEFAKRAIDDRKFLKSEDLFDVTWLYGIGNWHGVDHVL